MNKQRVLVAIIIVAVIGLGAYGVWEALQTPELEETDVALVGSELALPDVGGFASVDEPRGWSFPADYAPHPDFQREQWLLLAGEECGVDFMLTFDRLTLIPDSPLIPERDSEWAMNSVMNSTLVYPQDGEEQELMLTSRLALGLAGADDTAVWVENWRLDFAESTLYADSVEITLDASIDLETATTGSIEDGWYQYVREGQIDGRLRTGDDRQPLDCPVRLIHRFGDNLDVDSRP